MKKIIAIILALVLCFSLFSCGKKNDIEQDFKVTVSGAVNAECYISYEDVRYTLTTLNTIDVVDDVYTGTGVVELHTNSGETYIGKVTAVYRYNEETESFSKISLDIETPVKQ